MFVWTARVLMIVAFMSVAFVFSVLMHLGYCRTTASPPPSALQELRAVIRLLPPQKCKSIIIEFPKLDAIVPVFLA